MTQTPAVLVCDRMHVRPGELCLLPGATTCRAGRDYSEVALRLSLFNPRCRSLLRGTLLVLPSLAVALVLSHFPQNRPNALLVFPALAAMAGTVDHARCMRTRWSFYHGGVLLCLYMDLMVLSMILFFLLFPYASWLSATH